jgi:hypothetical protein
MIVPTEKHETEYRFDTIRYALNDHGINISNFRFQPHNATNMSGKYSRTNQELYALNYGTRLPLVFGSYMY